MSLFATRELKGKKVKSNGQISMCNPWSVFKINKGSDRSKSQQDQLHDLTN